MARTPRAGSSGAAQTIASASDRARAFRLARRHSVMVRFMRLTLPLIAVGLIGIYTATVMSMSALRSKGVTAGPISIDPKNLTMQAPRYDGFGKDGSRYVVRAREAITDLKQTGPVRLNDIDGVITQTSGVVTNLKAVWGTFDQKKDILELYEKIDIDGSNGTRARLTRATVHTKESRVVSDEPVIAENDTSIIRSRRMTLNNKSRQATFTEAVHVTLKPNPKNADAAKTGDALKAAAKQSAAPLGLAANSGQPVDVKAERLDVDDYAKTALFRQDVIAKQGDAILQAPELDVLYEGKATLDGGASATKAAEATDATKPPAKPEEQSKLKTIRARGGVIMTNKDDRATSETLDYDAATERAVLKGNVVMTSTNERQATARQVDLDQKADTALLTGSVVVVQGKNTMKAERMFVNRKAGTTRLESPGGRIFTQFYQNQAGKPETKAKADAKEKPAEPASPLAVSFKTDPNAPIDVESDTLDVEDLKKQAIYRGKVVAKQGDFIVETAQMTAFYTGQAGIASDQPGLPAAKGPKGGPRVDTKAEKGDKTDGSQSAQLTRIEARQKVIITGKDGQKAVGEWADFDTKANTVTMGGKVTLATPQGTVNMPPTKRLVIDMTTGISHFIDDPNAPPSQATPAVSAAGPASDAASGAAAAAAAKAPPAPQERIRVLLNPRAKSGEGGGGGSILDISRKSGKTGGSAWDATTTPSPAAPADRKQ